MQHEAIRVACFKLHAQNVWPEGDTTVVIRWLQGDGSPIGLAAVMLGDIQLFPSSEFSS